MSLSRLIPSLALLLLPGTPALHAQELPIDVSEFSVLELSEEPSISIGEAGNDRGYTFSSPTFGVLLEGGKFAVGDVQELTIRVFDASGVLVHTLGGRGDGPGEFRSLRTMGRFGEDGVWAWDRSKRRVTVFGADGEMIWDKVLDVSVSPVEGRADVVGVTDLGRILLETRKAPSELWTRSAVGLFDYEETVVVSVVDASSREPTELISLPGQTFRAQIRDGGRGAIGGVHSTKSMVRTNGASVIVGYSGEFRFLEVSAAGTWRPFLTLPSEERRLTEEELAGVSVGRRFDPATGEPIPGFESPVRELLPVWREFRFDSDGGLWAALHKSPLVRGVPWIGFDDTGAPVGLTWVPAHLQSGLLDIGPERLLTVRHDDFGVPVVELYRLFDSTQR